MGHTPAHGTVATARSALLRLSVAAGAVLVACTGAAAVSVDVFVNSRFLLDDAVVVAKVKATGEPGETVGPVALEWHDLSRGRLVRAQTVELQVPGQQNFPLAVGDLAPGQYEVRALLDGRLQAGCCFYRAREIDWRAGLQSALRRAQAATSAPELTDLLHTHLNSGGNAAASRLAPRLAAASEAAGDPLVLADAVLALCRHARVTGQGVDLAPLAQQLAALAGTAAPADGADIPLGLAAALASLPQLDGAQRALAEGLVTQGLAAGRMANCYWSWQPKEAAELRQARTLTYLTALERAPWQSSQMRELSLARITNCKYVTKHVDPVDLGAALAWVEAALDWGDSAYVEGMMGKVSAEMDRAPAARLARVISHLLVVRAEEAPWLEQMLSMAVPRLSGGPKAPPKRSRGRHAFALPPYEFFKPELTLGVRWRTQEQPEFRRGLGEGLTEWAQRLRQQETFGELRCRYDMDLGPWDSKYYLPDAVYAWDKLSAKGELSDHDRVRWLWVIREMERDLEWNQRYSTMGVHNAGATMIGALGVTAHYFEHFPEAAGWQKLARDRLPWMFTGLLGDGGWFEGTPAYHCYALAGFYDYFKAAKVVHDEDLFSLQFGGKSVDTMIDWIVKEMTPLRVHTCNNDGGETGIDTDKLLELAELAGSGEYVYLAGSEPGVAGPKFGKTVARLPGFTTVLLPETGWAVFRDGWDRNSQYLCLDFGPKGGGHGHYDKGSVEVFADGHGWILDNGYGDGSTLRHNTVVVDGACQSEVTGKLVDFHAGWGVDLASCEHAGYAGIGVSHRRTVVYLRSGYWLLFDLLTAPGDREHRYTWRAQTKSTVASCDPRQAVLREGDTGMVIANSSPSAFSRAEQLGFAHFNRTSMEYYQQTTGVPLEPGRCVEYELSSAAASVPLEFALIPFAATAPEVSCQRLPSEQAQVVAITLNGRTDLVGVARDPTKPGAIDAGGVETDAAYFVRQGEAERPDLLFLHRGTRLRCGQWSIRSRDGQPTTVCLARIGDGMYRAATAGSIDLEMPAGTNLTKAPGPGN
jgi:Heparinase II/III-like protein/Heparinase II/III N-terminus